MRIILAAGLAALLSAAPAIAAADSAETQLIAREKQSWAAWQGKDLAFWQGHLSADHVEIDGPDGPQDRNYVLKGIAGRACAVDRYDLDRFAFRPLGPGAAMLVYHATQEFSCGDKRIPNEGWVTSVYRLRNGRWENVLFEHYAVPPPKPAATPKF